MTAVLLVRLSAMGDLVQGLGAVTALLAARPDWRFGFVTQRPFAPLLDQFAPRLTVHPFDRRGGLGKLQRLRADLRAAAYDVALDLQGNWKSAAIARLAGAAAVWGGAAAVRQEPTSRWLLHRAVSAPLPPHPARIAAALATALVPGLAPPLPRLLATAAELAAEAAALTALGIDAGRPFRLVVVTDPADPRALRPARIAAELARGGPVVQLLGPAESALAPLPGAPALRHGPGEIRRLVALGVLLARAGGEVLAPDQGAAHVLSAAGARCRVLFGAQDPRRTGPPGAAWLVHPEPPTCLPCRSDRCRHPAGPVCMDVGFDAAVPPRGDWRQPDG